MTTGTAINWILDSAGEHLISQPPGYTIFLVHHGSLVECTVFYQHEQIGNKVKSLAKAKRIAERHAAEGHLTRFSFSPPRC